MSAEMLRRAAALMRERAEAANEGPWLTASDNKRRDVLAGSGGAIKSRHANAAHIASWHPAVALVVADWLEAEAESHRVDLVGPYPSGCCRMPQALAVARAYLGEQS